MIKEVCSRFAFRKILLLPVALLVTPAVAQVKLSIGPTVGAIASTSTYAGNPAVYANPYLKPTYKVGAEAGIKAVITLGKVAIQPSLLYSQKGFELSGSYNEAVSIGLLTTNVQEKFRLNYLCFPVNIAYSFQEDGKGLQFFAGPYISALLGGKAEFDNSTRADNGYQTTYRTTQTIKSGPEDKGDGATYFQRYDAGFQAGLGYAYNNWLVQGSYSLGVVNTGVFYPMNASPYKDGSTYRNRGFSVNLSYLLPVSK